MPTSWARAELGGRRPAEPQPTDPDWAGGTVNVDRRERHVRRDAGRGVRGRVVDRWSQGLVHERVPVDGPRRARLARRRRRHAPWPAPPPTPVGRRPARLLAGRSARRPTRCCASAPRCCCPATPGWSGSSNRPTTGTSVVQIARVPPAWAVGPALLAGRGAVPPVHLPRACSTGIADDAERLHDRSERRAPRSCQRLHQSLTTSYRRRATPAGPADSGRRGPIVATAPVIAEGFRDRRDDGATLEATPDAVVWVDLCGPSHGELTLLADDSDCTNSRSKMRSVRTNVRSSTSTTAISSSSCDRCWLDADTGELERDRGRRVHRRPVMITIRKDDRFDIERRAWSAGTRSGDLDAARCELPAVRLDGPRRSTSTSRPPEPSTGSTTGSANRLFDEKPLDPPSRSTGSRSASRCSGSTNS